MKDVEYYRAHYEDPTFLFTPDAEFPVCYGEAGICSGTLVSAPIRDGKLEEIHGGVAVNAVPGEADAIVCCSGTDAAAADAKVSITQANGQIAIHAQGKSAHASTPELGENAIDILVAYLLDHDLVSPDERRFLELVRKVTSASDGTLLGVAASDAHFGALTAVGGIIALDGDRISLTIDFRYPTSTTASEIERCVQQLAAAAGATFTMEHDKEPFLMDPDSATVQAMLSAYNEATGESAQPFTMKGGTYARVFTTGASFGPEKPWEAKPDWVGSMHGPDEGISEELLKQAFSIYVRTIGKLAETGL